MAKLANVTLIKPSPLRRAFSRLAHHGVRVAEINDRTHTIHTVSTAVIGVPYPDYPAGGPLRLRPRSVALVVATEAGILGD
ncbi:MAG: hypothetical protein ACQEUY_17400 [Pseudomonadota bacterium]